MTYEQIVYEVRDAVATITLDRPEKLNAFTVQMQDELVAAFSEADADDAVRVVIVTGRGRGFCAGADVSDGGTSAFDRSHLRPEEYRDEGGLVSLRIFAMQKPVIAAINGPAVGVGVTMTLPMDIRLASESARFGFVFARRGLVPEACSSWFLPRVVGISRAMEWVASGRVFDAREALGGGLVRSLHAPDDLLLAAHALAREIADNTAPVATAVARQMLWRMLGADHPMEAHRVDSRGIYWLGMSPDMEEGVASFLEKRAPAFPLRVSRDLPPHVPWWVERPFA